MYKVLALDLDGTVLNSDNRISDQLRATIHALAQYVQVVLVTGRHHTAAKPYYAELELKSPIICCNGTYVFDYANQAVIGHNAIAKDQARKFIHAAEANDLKLVMYVQDAMLYSRSQPVAYMDQLLRWAETVQVELRPDIRQVDSFIEELEQTENIWKFVIEGNDVSHFDQLDLIRTHFSGERSWLDRIDYANQGNTKGIALARYVNKLGYSADQVVAIGDNDNDISMLSYAGLGVAMLNANDTVKQAAQLTTVASNDDPNVLADLLKTLFPAK
jgi:Cof subfamily protein (haloacid dehalogenase superfamily)